MNTRTLILAAAISFNGTSMAQSFNTISDAHPRYKVLDLQADNDLAEQSVSPSNTNTISKIDTSYIYMRVRAAKTSNSEHLAPYVCSPLKRKLVITSPYGWRHDPLNPSRSTFHSGIDLRAKNEPVYAMLPGEVVNTGYDSRAGYFITLQHGSLRVSYCHLSLIGVKNGTTVYAGEPIGVSGNSGTRSTGPHLHLTFKDASNQRISANKTLDLIIAYLQ